MSVNHESSQAGEETDDPAERQAADWFVQRRQGLKPAEEAQFQAWLAADPRHGELLQDMEETWGQLGHAPRPARTPPFSSPARKRALFPLILAAAACLAIGLFLGWRTWERNRTYSTVATTEVGALRNLELPEHSVVQLGADSVVSVDFTPTARRITLQRGEANFLVSKHAAWPFLVQAGGVEVRAVGTAFDVRMGTEAVDLLVTEGKVQVTAVQGSETLLKVDPGAPALLFAGQHVRLSLHAPPTGEAVPEILSPEKIADTLAWRERRLVFHGDRLGDIVEEFNRFNHHRLVIGTPELSERRFGGSFPAEDYDTLVQSLEHDYGIVGERLPQETRLKLAAPAAAAPPAGPAEGRLVFHSERLADIVAEFNRHNRHRLVIGSPELGDLRFGGTFPSDDYETFVHILEQDYHMIAVRNGDETLLQAGPPSPAEEKNP